MKLRAPIPLIRIFDHQLARRFYCEWLGFTVDWEHQFGPDFPRYLQVTRDAVTLHLTEHYGDCTPGSKVFIPIEGIDDLHRELHERRNPNMRPGIEDAPWNARILEVIDPFGNRLCFSEPKATS